MGGGGVTAILLAVVAMAAGIEAQRYTCWGGCYNVCIGGNNNNNPEGLSCYYRCLSRQCIPRTATDFEYYCQVGCSLQTCAVLRSSSEDGGRLEQCLDGCNNQCKI
ncbi:hypothetical protein M569_16206 [Genlisea aurea]|uniref:Acidic protein n=1 Tax=Genlisea aurea TaxID=192259 RepID=S8DGU1_9LAMI|nr:hypothetical protein M569_16206 [Genlisea aurea]